MKKLSRFLVFALILTALFATGLCVVGCTDPVSPPDTAAELLIAKNDAKAAVTAEKNKLNLADYREEEQAEINALELAAHGEIDALATKAEVLAYDLNAFKARLAAVKTAAQIDGEQRQALENERGGGTVLD